MRCCAQSSRRKVDCDMIRAGGRRGTSFDVFATRKIVDHAGTAEMQALAPPERGMMADRILSPDLLAALDRFIQEQHPEMSRYDALKLAFRDWALVHGYLDGHHQESEVFPAGRRIALSRTDRAAAGGLLDRFIAEGRPKDAGDAPSD